MDRGQRDGPRVQDAPWTWAIVVGAIGAVVIVRRAFGRRSAVELSIGHEAWHALRGRLQELITACTDT